MQPAEAEVHSFIVKFWRESAWPPDSPLWRGHVTHVPSGARRYVQDYTALLDFMRLYLQRPPVPLAGSDTGDAP
ncbi:MAG TPA: hypothetical protein VFI42_07980 [Thermomicrobiaceae bacterium]|nr:hypothetical protein [Thermomicrobiaceae bacterium]